MHLKYVAYWGCSLSISVQILVKDIVLVTDLLSWVEYNVRYPYYCILPDLVDGLQSPFAFYSNLNKPPWMFTHLNYMLGAVKNNLLRMFLSCLFCLVVPHWHPT